MLESLKKEVLKANLELPKRGLVTYTWGNVSAIDKKNNIIAIKPSGVEYSEMKVNDIVLVDLEGNKIEGELKPSSDTLTHLYLYKHFKNIGGIVHTHSPWSTSWAQAGKEIPVYGTTHADYFYGDILCTRKMSIKEIENKYETNTGKVIIERFKDTNPIQRPGVLVNGHGPFAWGESAANAVCNAVIMEEIAKMAYRSVQLNSSLENISQSLLDRHFLRKHGENAYYGQKN